MKVSKHLYIAQHLFLKNNRVNLLLALHVRSVISQLSRVALDLLNVNVPFE